MLIHSPLVAELLSPIPFLFRLIFAFFVVRKENFADYKKFPVDIKLHIEETYSSRYCLGPRLGFLGDGLSYIVIIAGTLIDKELHLIQILSHLLDSKFLAFYITL